MGNCEQYDIVWVVVTYNSARDIEKCIASLYAYRPRHLRQIVVIVDNASIDDTPGIIKRLSREHNDLLVIQLDKNNGFGAANNAAFRTVDARFYVLINADAWLISNSVGPAIDAMEACSNAAICGIPLIFPDGSPQTYTYQYSSGFKWLVQFLGFRRFAYFLITFPCFSAMIERFNFGREYVRNITRKKIEAEHLKPSVYSGAARTVDWVCGAAMVIRGDFIKKSGGFDDGFFLYGEDEDLCLEAKRQGYAVIVVDAPPVVHRFGWGYSASNPRIADMKYRSLQYFIDKNITGLISRFMARLMLPLHVYGWKFFTVWRHHRRK